MEVADLYKAAVPETKTLLSDIQQLATFHKRMGEVDGAHQELKEYLLPGVVADQIESWQETLAALSSFGAFISAAPQAASVIPTIAVTISMRPDDPLITRLSEMLQPVSVDASSNAKELMGLSNLRINEALQFVSELQLATNRCTAAIQASHIKYQTKPDMQQLLNDIASAKVYAKSTISGRSSIRHPGCRLA